jgi:chromosome segregation ATPase
MDNAEQILTILTDVAPLVLSTLILGGIVLFGLWAAVKVVIPAMRETVEMAEAQRKMWLSIVEEQKRVNSALITEAQNDLTAERVERKKLEASFEEMKAELAHKDAIIAERDATIARRDAQIAEILASQDKLQKTQDETIAQLRRELDTVKDDRKRVETERDELIKRIDALEAAQKTEGSNGTPVEKAA